MLRRFNQAFGIEDSLDVERSRFVNRINGSLFMGMRSNGMWSGQVFPKVCFELGESVAAVGSYAAMQRYRVPYPEHITRNDFMMTLKVLQALHRVGARQQYQWLVERVERDVTEALALATVDIGVVWRAGEFLPTGAEELDERLVLEPYKWLEGAPEVRDLFRKCVWDHAEKRLDDAVATAYRATERLACLVLQNDRNLENNKSELLQRLGLAPQWGAMLNNYMSYAHEYARHANQTNSGPVPREAEAFIYQTGLLLRLMLRASGQGAET